MAISWKTEFAKKLREANNTDELARLGELVTENLPKKLYKYYPLSDAELDHKNCYALKNFEDDFVWLSKPYYFNDPFDSRLATGDMDFIFRAGRGQNTEAIVRNFDQSIRRSLNICCFSERIDSIILWSRYANNHRGFCAEYDFDSIKKNNVNKALTGNIYPVIYSRVRYKARQLFAGLSGNEMPDGLLAIKESLYKSRDWMYEREWRVVRLTQENRMQAPMEEGGIREKIQVPAAVYLGCETEKEPESLKELTRITGEKNIPAFKMRISNDRYEMVAERFI